MTKEEMRGQQKANHDAAVESWHQGRMKQIEGDNRSGGSGGGGKGCVVLFFTIGSSVLIGLFAVYKFVV